jgi:hypothetical protein
MTFVEAEFEDLPWSADSSDWVDGYLDKISSWLADVEGTLGKLEISTYGSKANATVVLQADPESEVQASVRVRMDVDPAEDPRSILDDLGWTDPDRNYGDDEARFKAYIKELKRIFPRMRSGGYGWEVDYTTRIPEGTDHDRLLALIDPFIREGVRAVGSMMIASDGPMTHDRGRKAAWHLAQKMAGLGRPQPFALAFGRLVGSLLRLGQRWTRVPVDPFWSGVASALASGTMPDIHQDTASAKHLYLPWRRWKNALRLEPLLDTWQQATGTFLDDVSRHPEAGIYRCLRDLLEVFPDERGVASRGRPADVELIKELTRVVLKGTALP